MRLIRAIVNALVVLASPLWILPCVAYWIAVHRGGCLKGDCWIWE